jgi:hypothetical protein
MIYHVSATSFLNQDATLHIKQSKIKLLKKNIEKLDTIYNRVKLSCSVSGSINRIDNV